MTLVTPGTDALPTGQYGKYKVHTTDINKPCVGVTVIFSLPFGGGIFAGNEALTNDVNTGSAIHWLLMRYLTVLGKPAGGKLVSLTDDNTATGGSLYDPTNFAKLVDTNFGLPSVKIIDDLGEVTDSIAERVGRAELKSLLERGDSREYEFDSELATLPLPGETVLMADSFLGYCVKTMLTMTGGKETVVVTLVDLS